MSFMRIVEMAAAAAFIAMALIQFNDPDPLYWVVVYAATAWIVGANAFGRTNRTVVLIVLGLDFAGLLIAAPGFFDYLRSGDFASIGGDMAGSATYVEASREFLGLAIALAALLYVLSRPRIAE